MKRGLWKRSISRLRDRQARTVDDALFGGGAGMVMRADVVDSRLRSRLTDAPLVYLTPRGERSSRRTQPSCYRAGVRLICEHEGIDQRVLEARDVTEISLGDFVLSGGEPAALALIDACVPPPPGVCAKCCQMRSLTGECQHPHYARPADRCGRRSRTFSVRPPREYSAWRTTRRRSQHGNAYRPGSAPTGPEEPEGTLPAERD